MNQAARTMVSRLAGPAQTGEPVEVWRLLVSVPRLSLGDCLCLVQKRRCRHAARSSACSCTAQATCKGLLYVHLQAPPIGSRSKQLYFTSAAVRRGT